MQETVLRLVRLYCERTGTAESTFGRLAVNDPALVRGMRNGREVRPQMARRIREFMGVTL